MMKYKEWLLKMLSRCEPDLNTGCLLWPGATGRGYPRVGREYKSYSLGRLLYEELVGPINPDQVICHKCDTPQCLNIDHFFLGTQKENILDAKKKGRMRGAHFGDQNHNSKLTYKIVEMCRRDFKNGASINSLARRQGVNNTVMRKALLGITWKEKASEEA